MLTQITPKLLDDLSLLYEQMVLRPSVDWQALVLNGLLRHWILITYLSLLLLLLLLLKSNFVKNELGK